LRRGAQSGVALIDVIFIARPRHARGEEKPGDLPQTHPLSLNLFLGDHRRLIIRLIPYQYMYPDSLTD
jgi:hypothetical protein